MSSLEVLSTGDYVPDWCPGCGDFGILNSLKRAIVQLKLKNKDVVICAGIGCSSKMAQWINTFGYHSLHGRGLPVGLGVKMANKNLHVIVIGGDGDVYGEGMNHFIQALRKNINITLLVHDNQVYGLTKGQTSPTTMHGDVTKSAPTGNFDIPVNPISLAVAQKAAYIANGYAGDMDHLTQLLADAISFKGFSLVNVLQPCVTWNHHNTYDWFKERVYDMNKKGYKPNNLEKAFKKSQEMMTEKIPIGVFFREERQLFEDTHPTLKGTKALTKQRMDNVSVKDLMEQLCK